MSALVLLHGFTGGPESFDPVLRCLPPSVHRLPCFRPALVGHRGAERVRSESFESEVDRIAREIRGRGLSGAYLCGYSLGARVGLGLLARHRSLLRGATLVGVHSGLGSPELRRERSLADAKWCAELSRGLRGFLARWEAQPLFSSQLRLPEAVLSQQRQLRLSQSAADLSRCLRVMGLARMPDYRSALCHARLPITLVTGALDHKFTRLANDLTRGGRQLFHWQVRDAGHNVVLEAPDALAGVLREVLPS